ncbi:MAG TPA: alkaline phosphatase PhoX [Planctomycetota bacterium]|nr:alkaline phosphatase PhoX [Planctomycetota bacterium]
MSAHQFPVGPQHGLPPHRLGRREFLFAAGAAGLAVSAVSCRHAGATTPTTSRHDFAEFEPVASGVEDKLAVPKGFAIDVIAAFGDEVGTDASGLPVRCGAACDFTAFVPDTGSANEGILFVNHEYPEEVMLGGKPVVLAKTGKGAEQIAREMQSVGFSRLHVRRGSDGRWRIVRDSKRARRVDALGPSIAVAGTPEMKRWIGDAVPGSLANCSGGVSPWAMFSCEENFQNYFRRGAELNYGWTPEAEGAKKALGYGWVVEVPHDPALPMKKHTALGRFRHENVAIRCVANEKLVVYMGDDSDDQHFYKFVSDDKCTTPAAPENSSLLEKGRLYVADVKNGEWLWLDLEHWRTRDALKYEKATKALRERLRAEKLPKDDAEPVTQAEALAFPDTVAKAIGGTPLDRPEDCEIGPDGGVYIALTNNKTRGNFWGSIARLEETDGHAGEKLSFAHLVHGGEQTKFACPDNLCFDPAGDLWFTTDRAEDDMGKPVYKPYGNNSLFRMRRSAPGKLVLEQFCTAPVDAELTGPSFTADGSTLFLSVQHPGICAKTGETRSRWPAAGNDPNATASASNQPRSAVVAIRRIR